MPVCAEPVNSTPSSPSCAASAWPCAGPPARNCTTVAGMPAWWKQRTSSSPVAGAFSLGLTITALPAISAGTICPIGASAGRFHGPSTASTPCGLCRTALTPLQRAVELALRAALGIGADRGFDAGDDGFDFGHRFPQGLAGFARDGGGQAFLFLAHFVGEAADQFHAGG
jgi:hypothetical protein